jgi:hypothetical protein
MECFSVSDRVAAMMGCDCMMQGFMCYGRLAVVSDVDDGGVCPECRQRVERSAVLYRSKYNGAMLGSR